MNTTDQIKADIATYDQELKTVEANFHRLTGAKLAMEALLTKMSQQLDAPPVYPNPLADNGQA